MTMQGNQAGIAQAQEYAFVAAPGGQSRFVGVDSKGFVLNYSSGFLWAIVDGFWVSPDDFVATDGSAITFNAPVDQGTSVRLISIPPFNIANVYTQGQSDALYTKRRNRIIDPGMRVSQENGNNLLTIANGVAIWASDSVIGYRVGNTGSATIQRIALATPGGSPYRIRATVTAVNAAPAAGDQLSLTTRIEGLDIADLKFGSAAAKTIAVRIGCRASVPGIYSIAILNAPQTRAWIGSIAIASAEVGIDVVKPVTLVADQTGTWAADTTNGLHLVIGLTAGSNYIGVAGWQAGGAYSLAGAVNLMATNGATFDLFDVGLYDVTGLQNGVIPPFELASFPDDLNKCQRYYNKTYDLDILPGAAASAASTNYQGSIVVGVCDSANNYTGAWEYPTEMRVVPSVVVYNAYTGASGSAYSTASGNTYTAGPSIGGRRRVNLYSGGAAAGNNFVMHATANARL